MVARPRAKKTRGEPAPAEQKLWSCLRNLQLNGFKFRRQHGIDRYIADFFYAECKLIVELDGESHADREAYDERRTSDLGVQGYVVVRYSNVDVFENLESVLTSLLEHCEKARPSTSGPSS